MSEQDPKPPDPERRNFLRSFTDPDKMGEYGRNLGRIVREFREAVDPSSVPLEMYLASKRASPS